VKFDAEIDHKHTYKFCIKCSLHDMAMVQTLRL